jgi:hypothetical protein
MGKGQCSCGAVRFEFDEPAKGIYVCHCSLCRRSTGTNGIAVVVVPNERFRWLAGEDAIVAWTKPGSEWETFFCRTCGSKVPGRNDGERMFIPAGVLDDPGELQVIHHLFVGSRAPWDVIGDGGAQHVERIGG